MILNSKKIGFVGVVITTILFSNSGLAQSNEPDKSVTPKNGISFQWRWMDMVAFNANPTLNLPRSTPEQRKIVEEIWGKEINSTPLNKFAKTQSHLPSFILFSSFKENGIFYTFSIFDAADAPGCIAPGNGAGVVDMYSVCPLRVTVIHEATGKSFNQNFNNYCHLFINDKENPSSKNHTEIQIDPSKGLVNFRVIQYGKQVPQCNRSLKYKEIKS